MRPRHDFDNILAAPSASEIDELAERSGSLEQRIASLNDSYETLKKREVELTEWRWVLREAGGFFDRVSNPIEMYLIIAQTDRLSRLVEMLMKSATRPTMTKPHYCKTSNISPEDSKVIMLASNPLLS